MREIVERVDRLQRLAVFESAARLGSFSGAARELGITQPAATRQIRALEKHLGHALFARSSNRSQLNEAGRILYRTVGHAFDGIERGIEEMDHEIETFGLATGPSMAHFVLLPMLDSLRHAVGAIDIRITTLAAAGGVKLEQFDAVTQIDPAPSPTMHRQFLFPEVVVPMASPRLADELGLSASTTAGDLLAAPLIHEARGVREWMSWAGWCEANGVPAPKREPRVLLNDHPLVIQQAVAGAGVALGWRFLVDNLVSTGLLVPVGEETPTGRNFYLTWYSDSKTTRCQRVADAIVDFTSTLGPPTRRSP